MVIALTIGVLSIQRYIAICHSFLLSKYDLSSIQRATKTAFIIWFMGFAIALPVGLYHGLVLNKHDFSKLECTYTSDTFAFSIRLLLVFFYLIPLLTICMMYTLICKKGKKSTESANKTRTNYRKTPKIFRKISSCCLLLDNKRWRFFTKYH